MAHRPFGRGTRTTYYLLVLFTLLTVLVSVLLNARLERLAREILDSNEQSAERLARLARVEAAANDVNDPADSIFSTGDPARERARTATAAERFRQTLAASRADWRGNAVILAKLDRIDAALATMLRTGEDVLHFYEQGNLAAAAASNATMDQVYADLRLVTGEVDALLREQQLAELRQHDRSRQLLRRWQNGGIGMMAMLGVALVFYGRRLGQETDSSAERERYLEALQEREAALQHAISERNERQEKLRLSEERFQMVSQATSDLVWDRDLVTDEIWVNEVFASRFGYPHWGAIDIGIWESCIHPDDRDSSYAKIRQAIESSSRDSTSEHRFRASDGEWRDVLDRGLIVRNAAGTAVRMIGVMMDISERRTVERMKDEFISTVSHELRTPLTSIRGALGLLASGLLGSLPEKGQRLLDIASKNTERLVRLINDILDIERIESGQVSLTKVPCDGGALALQVAETLGPLAGRARIEIRVDARPAPLVADPDRMIQTLTNLVGNAIKFSPADSTIVVTVRTEGANVTLSVADRGRGIPAGKLGTIFERFQQVDASDSRDKGGSGLGLAICRTLVRQHGGDIRVESEPGEGSTFTVTVPANVLAPPEEAAARRLVFVCDDDSDTRGVMSYFLSRRGYQVRETCSGEELLDAVARQKPDAIMLDLFMPGMNGWETLARLKHDPAAADIPVIVVSVLPPHESGESGLELSGWVQKPLDETTLGSVLDRAFRKQDRRPRLLLVEDDVDLAVIIIASFERWGIETIHARDGKEAIELIQRLDPDLLILDLILPGMDGYAVVDWLKDHHVGQGLPLVVYSATEPSPSQRERLRLGPTEFMTKSLVTPEDFEGRIVALLDTLTLTRNEAEPADIVHEAVAH